MSKKITQAESNRFLYSDSNKRYYTYDYYLRRTFGAKVAKVVLDAGFTCPNIDGRCGVGGCIYCSGRGSGDFAASPTLSIEEQYRLVREKMSGKWNTEKCIPYFQAHTNTYAPLERLQECFETALGLEGAVGLNIATRADCLPQDACAYLASLAERTVLTVELGLQTSDDDTAKRINRGHCFADFEAGFQRLRCASEKIGICVHIIFGLPGENRNTMLKTVEDVARLHPNQVKIHLLHVLRNTPLAAMYESGSYIPMEREEYVTLVADAIERLPADIVIARLTGDGLASDLLAPLWSIKKVSVINDIDKLLYARGAYQGDAVKGF